MILSRPINFDQDVYDALRQKYSVFAKDIGDQGSFKKIILGNELIDLGNNIIKPISLISSKTHQIKSAILFGQSIGHIMEIHVDGFSLNRKDASNWALNLPIVGTGNMFWYDGKYELSEHVGQQKLKYLKLNWHDEPKEIYQTIIDSPSIVRIDLPHRVINISSEPRLLLSIRFTPDIY